MVLSLASALILLTVGALAVVAAWIHGHATGTKAATLAQEAAAGKAAVAIEIADAAASTKAELAHADIQKKIEAELAKPAGEDEIDALIHEREAARASGRKP